MAIIVEHDKRKRDILTRSLDLFIEEGYDDVTYQKIADRCSITRTTLYIYFKNKRDIFLAAIKQFTSDLETQLLETIKRTDIDSIECLKQMMLYLVDETEKHGNLFKVLEPYLLQLEKGGDNINERVARRVIRAQHLMSTVVIRGQKSGEIKKTLSVKYINGLLYSMLESAILRTSILNRDNLDDSREIVKFTVELFRA